MSPMLRESRFDFRAGLNTAFSQDTRDQRELAVAQNCRHGEYGAIEKRAGTQRIHENAIGGGANVLGLVQYFPSAGRTVVAISNGDLYHKLQTADNFTEVSGSFSTTVRPGFAVHIISGTPTLYIADGTLRSWNGTSISAVSGAPNALRLAVYKTRMFASDGTKTIYWSKVSDPSVWASPDGGSAQVETYDATGIIGLEVVGGSLLIFKENSIARFRGVDADTIEIDLRTDGVSPDVGAIAAGSIVRVEETVFFVSDRGPYLATEAGVKAVGVNIEPAFDSASLTNLSNAVSVHHKARREVWVFIPESGESTNNVGYCWNYRVGSWTGPWYFSDEFDVCAAAQYELTDATESVILGGYDGFVRRGDVTAVGAVDDVLKDDSGGTNITLVMTLPDLLFGDATAVKKLRMAQEIEADLKTSGSLVVAVTGDHHSGSQSVTLASTGTGVKPYRFRPGTQGRRLVLSMTDATAEIIQINGITLASDAVRRTA